MAYAEPSTVALDSMNRNRNKHIPHITDLVIEFHDERADVVRIGKRPNIFHRQLIDLRERILSENRNRGIVFSLEQVEVSYEKNNSSSFA